MVPPTILFSHNPGVWFSWEGLIGGMVCFGIFLAAMWFFLKDLAADLARGYSEVFRRTSKNPRFGILTLLEVFFGVAVFLALFRWAGWMTAPGLLIALLVATLTVGLIHLLFSDTVELFTRPGKPKEPASDDPWEKPEKERLEFGAEEEKKPPPEL